MTLTTEPSLASAGEAQPQEPTSRLTAAQFEAIFLEHWPRIYGVLVRLVGDHAEAEDLALETFWRLYRRPPARRRSNLGGWLYRVAANLGLNALRAWKRRQSYEQQAAWWETGADPEETLAEQERRRCVRRVLSRMNPRQSKLLILRYSGLSYRELAAALDVSVNSIGAMLVRAEREFEKRYRKIDPDGG